jgi:hypothetical protein
MSRETGIPDPSVKFSCVMQNDNYRAVVEATIRLREKTGRSVSRSVVIDALVATSDMDAIVEEIAKRGE